MSSTNAKSIEYENIVNAQPELSKVEKWKGAAIKNT